MTDSPTQSARTFAGLPDATIASLDGARIAILGADHGSPYKPGVASHAAGGAAAIRAGSQLFAKQLSQFDFDIGGVLRPDPEDRRIVDCGDLRLDLADGMANRAAITAGDEGGAQRWRRACDPRRRRFGSDPDVRRL